MRAITRNVTTATDPLNQTTTYQYDPANRFAYDGNMVWADLDSSNNLTVRRMYGDVIDQLFARIGASGTGWYLTDRLGSVVNLINNSGTILNTTTYDSFGTPTDSSPGNADRYKHTGREWNAVVESGYFRARNTMAGRFMQEDRVVDDPTNNYRYVRNNPLVYTDPMGLEPIYRPEPYHNPFNVNNPFAPPPHSNPFSYDRPDRPLDPSWRPGSSYLGDWRLDRAIQDLEAMVKDLQFQVNEENAKLLFSVPDLLKPSDLYAETSRYSLNHDKVRERYELFLLRNGRYRLDDFDVLPTKFKILSPIEDERFNVTFKVQEYSTFTYPSWTYEFAKDADQRYIDRVKVLGDHDGIHVPVDGKLKSSVRKSIWQIHPDGSVERYGSPEDKERYRQEAIWEKARRQRLEQERIDREIAQMGYVDKLKIVFERTNVLGETGEKLKALVTDPVALATVGGFLGLYVAGHWFGYGYILDGVFFAVAGVEGVRFGWDLGAALLKVADAQSSADLDRAASSMTDVLSGGAAEIVIAALFYIAGKAVPAKKPKPPTKRPDAVIGDRIIEPKLPPKPNPLDPPKIETVKPPKPFLPPEIFRRAATAPDTAFFWSGRSDGVAAKAIAEQVAKTKGGTTLEQLIEQRGIKMPEWNPNDPRSIAAWDELSREYAAYASGEVRAIIGKDLRPGSTWERIELPTLKSNRNVTKITVIDPATRRETVIFER